MYFLLCLIAIGLLIGFIPFFWVIFGLATFWIIGAALFGDNDPRPVCPDMNASSSEWMQYERLMEEWFKRHPDQEQI